MLAMKEAKTIDEVLQQLDEIIEETVAENNYLGIFAYVYRRTTAQIKQAVEEKRFEDNIRMEKMDVVFANLYIKAYYSYKENKDCSKAWKTSFEAQKKKISIIQHLMLGMNAHINLDLGQAAASSASKENIDALENDFMEVNKVLAELTDTMQKKMGKVSPFMFILDWVGGRNDEVLVNFSMIKARNQAWKLAKELASGDQPEAKQKRIDRADKNVTRLSKIIIRPPFITLNLALLGMKIAETKKVGKIIEALETA